MASQVETDYLGQSPLGPEAAMPPVKPLLWGSALAAVVVLLVAVVSYIGVQGEIDRSRAALASRMELIVAARGELVAAWQDQLHGGAARLADNDGFRLFAADLDAAGGELARMFLPTPQATPQQAPGGAPVLADQLPYLTQAVADYVSASGASAAFLVGRNGGTLLASPAGAALRPSQLALAKGVVASGRPGFGPVRVGASDLEVDYMVPVRAPQTAEGGAAVAALVATLPIGRKVQSFLRPGRAAGEDSRGRLHLYQAEDGRLFELAPDAEPPLRLVSATAPQPGANLAFARREGRGDVGEVFSVGQWVAPVGWWLSYELPVAAANETLRGFIGAVMGLAVLVLVVVLAVMAGLWWRLRADYSRSLADQYRGVAVQLEQQKRFLDSITGAITDQIGLKDASGRYVFVNPAFARAVGRPAEDLKGLDDVAIFGHGTAQRLKRWDDLVRASGLPMTVEEDVYIESKPHHLQVSKVPFRGPDGHPGTLSVARDVTDAVEQQRRRERAVRQTIAALVRAVELRDPYLAGHSRRMSEIAVAIARALKAPAEVVTTVEVAANLSQIGKLGIRRELLTKTSRLTPEERSELERHVGFAGEVLREIDFGVPVLDAIMEMHERLDGSGYPNRLAGAEISIAGRILGVADVFCARIAARSYRPGIAPAEALEVLTQNSARYDPDVVRALAEVANSVAGEKLVAGAAAA